MTALSRSGAASPTLGSHADLPPPDTREYDPRRWLAAAVMFAATFMELLDATIVNVAIPSIQHGLGAGYADIQWITGGYALAFALLLITGGRLGDIIGRKRTFLLGIGGFTVASLICGVAANPEVLAGARILQGVAAAVMVPQVMSIIHTTFPAGERPKALAIFGAISGMGAVAGPILGGLLIAGDAFGLGWRAIFLINVPAGLIALIAGHRLIRESRPANAPRLDLPGVLLATLGLLMLIYPLVQGRELGWPWWSFASMAGSAVVLLLFVAHQRARTRRGRSPLVILDLFRARTFAAGLGVQVAFYVVVGLFFLSWSLYLQVGLGFGALHAGLTTLGFAVGAFLSSAVAVAVLVGRFGRRVLMAGVVVETAGIASMIWVVDHFGADVSSWNLLLPLLVLGFGFGLVAAPLPMVILTDVPVASSGSASGLANTMVQLGNTVGVALVSLTFLLPLERGAGGAAGFTDAFQVSLGSMIGVLLLVLAVTFALPRHVRSQ